MNTKEQTIIRKHESIWTFWTLRWIFVIPFLGYVNKTLAVTDRRVILRRGILSKSERSARLEHILDVILIQGPFGRLFGHGTLAIETAGTTGTEFVFPRLAGAAKARRIIVEAQEAMARESKRV